MIGSIAANLHEGSRSEYLAQYVLSSIGTSIPVPHQEDSGLDLYCTLLERIGQRAWPRAYFSVQVKSTLDSWVFDGTESVRWLIEHPLPVFLCIVLKKEARILVYATTPRFAAWADVEQPTRLELIPGTETTAETIRWASDGDSTFLLAAPILDFTIQNALDDEFRLQIAAVLQHWIDYDVDNLARIRNGVHALFAPYAYSTNSTKFTGGTKSMGGQFRDESAEVAAKRLAELLGLFASHHHRKDDMVSAAIYALAFRHLVPDSKTGFNPHDHSLHVRLNELFGVDKGSYVFKACDEILAGLTQKVEEKAGSKAQNETAEPSQND